jgi:hypothetical protein
MNSPSNSGLWPRLDYPWLHPTAQTLHLCSQVVGKVRLALTPWLNHSWHVVLYVSVRGLTTGLVPAPGGGIELELDFTAHALVIRSALGGERRVRLQPGSVADFHAAVISALSELGVQVSAEGAPNELPEAVPFVEDHAPREYDPEAANAFWRALLSIDPVLKRFRTAFLGKSSPVHFFWGSFDLAVTRFSGRRAPLHPGGIPHLPDAVTREAYSHEVSSAGFWPGGPGVEAPSFYSYAYPTPEGFDAARIRPAEAAFSKTLGEFLLPYEAVRASGDPEAMLLQFLQSTYEAAADLGRWDRTALECEPGRPGRPRPVG